MASDQSEPAELPRLGSVFGHYRLDALVGRGGMGVVFRATDLLLERSVALKFLAATVAEDDAVRRRFIRESRLAAAIEHPSIVPIYEAGIIGGSPFIAMRFVPGRDLRTILRLEAPLELARTAALAAQIADALDAAHRRGLVHRDVKPANLLIETEGQERAYLADFGLSRRLGDASASSRSGAVGTLDYIAPEQVLTGPIDGRADQYALACLVVHCLTGSPPFDLDSDAAVLYAHAHADPPRLQSLRPDLSATAEDAITRAMSKSPEDRFPDCRSFVEALEAPAAAAPDSRAGAVARGATATTDTSRGRQRRRQRRATLLASLAIGVTIPVVAGVLLVAPGRPAGSADATDPALSPATPVAASVTDLRAAEVVVFASDVDGDWDIYVLEAGRARPRRLTSSSRDERSPAISPDGRTIAYVVGIEPARDIWLMDHDGTKRRPLVTHSADDIAPAWSSDGRSLAFASERKGVESDYDIYEIRDRGAGLSQGNARNLTARIATEAYPTWRPGTRQLAIASNYFGLEREIVLIDADDRSSQRRLTRDEDAFNLTPDHSPDGRSIAFVRRPFDRRFVGDRGIPDVLVTDARTGAVRRLTATPQRYEMDPDWSPDGRAIAYTAGTATATEIWVMSADGRRRRQLTRGWANAAEPAWGLAPAGVEPTPSPSG